MKKLLLYIILLGYTVVVIKPLLPFVTDFVAHVFFYAHHMATVHYENGKYHVHYQTAKEAKQESSDTTSSTPTSKKDNSSTEHILINTKQIAVCMILLNMQYHTTVTPETITGISSINYPPPRI